MKRHDSRDELWPGCSEFPLVQSVSVGRSLHCLAFEESLEVVGKCRRCLVTIVRVLGACAMDNRFQSGWNSWVATPDRRQGLSDNPAEQLFAIARGETGL